MKAESWQGINGKLVHDDQKAIVVDDDQKLTDQKQLQAILDQDGQPIDEVRRAMIKKTVKRQLKTPPFNSKRIFSLFNYDGSGYYELLEKKKGSRIFGVGKYFHSKSTRPFLIIRNRDRRNGRKQCGT